MGGTPPHLLQEQQDMAGVMMPLFGGGGSLFKS